MGGKLMKVSFKIIKGKYIEGRINYDANRTQFQTGVILDNPKLWGGSRMWMKGKSRESEEVNNELEKIVADLKKVYNKLKDYPNLDVQTIKDAYLNKSLPTATETPLTVVTALQFIRSEKALEHRNSTSEYYTGKINSIQVFLRNKYGVQDLPLKSLNRTVINDYYSWLLTTGTKSPLNAYSAYQYCSAISTAVDFVMKEFPPEHHPEMIKYNPINGVIKRPRKQRQQQALALSNYVPFHFEQVIFDTHIPGKTAYYPNDWWKYTALFQWNTGFGFQDLGANHWEIVKTMNGDFIECLRVKNVNPCFIPVLPDLERVIEKLENYKGQFNAKLIFPFKPFVLEDGETTIKSEYDASYSNYRNFLARMHKHIEIPVKMKPHTFRHTFAMKALNVYKYSYDEVAHMLGDRPKTVMDHYATITRDRLAETTEKVRKSL